MKKILLFASAVAGLILAGSCQQENLQPVAGDGTVTITVEAPGAIDTKAIADGENVNEVHYAVYKTNDGEAYSINDGTSPLAQGVVGMSNKRATIKFDLLQDQEYTVIFWAQVKDAGHYELGDLREIKVVTTEVDGKKTVDGNDETRAAFFAKYEFDTYEHKNHTVTLYRPFAQLNLLTTQESLKPVQEGQTQGYEIDVEESKVVVTGLSTSFDTVEGVGLASDGAEFVYAMNTTPEEQGDETLTVNDVAYHYVAMNYLFVPADADDKALVGVAYEVKTDKGNIENSLTNVPVGENYRTNIIGNLLTKTTEFTIIVDKEFNAPEYVLGENWVHNGNYDYTIYADAPASSLKEVLDHADEQATAAATKAAGPVVTINLEGDVYWETGAGIGSTPLLPEESLISEVVINGNGKTFTATGKGVGNIRLANGGKLTLNNMKIVDESVSYAENSWEYGYLEFGGVIRLEECDVVNAIMISCETAAFKSCSFNSHEDNQYAVWVDNGSAYFTDCTFKGARGLKTHEAYGSEVVKITVDGCTFDNLTKKPGMAIGDVNPETTIAIKNSFFFGCQPGDQGLYIYESDTDVTTFTFVLENNEVHANPSAMLKEWVENAQAGDVVEVPAGEYTFPASSFKEGVTLKCAEGTVFTGNSKLNIKGSTVIGATFSNPSGTAADQTVNGTFKDCVFEGKNALRWCYAGETVVFENCVFSGSTYGVHFDGGVNDAIFKNCTFSGFNAFGGAITMATFDGCTFVANGKSAYNGANLWGNTTMINTEFTFDGTASTEWVDLCGASTGTYTFNGCTVCGEPMPIETIGTYTDNNDEVDITFNGVLYENYKTITFIETADDLVAFAKEVNENKNNFSGKTVYLMADIDLAGIDWEPIGQTGNCTFNGVFEGYNHTISNLSVDSEDQTGAHYSSGLFGWVESHSKDHGHIKNVKISGATVKGHHNCGALVGYITQQTALVENCHVTAATISCTYANGDADGDKAGALIGNATVATPVKSCTAANSTVSAGRDAGQVIGAGNEANVTGCSATDVTVEANGTGTGANVRNELIGRLLK